MTDLSPTLALKVAKLLPMLASDRDGEVVATARAIGRTLRVAGLDLHVLAKIVLTPRTPVLPHKAEEVTPRSWRDLARWCRDNDAGRLTSAERKFVTALSALLVMDGSPTERQANWLRAIYARLCAEGRL